MLVKHSKLSDYKVKKLSHCFCEDLNAKQTASLTGINRNTINRYYRIFRLKIALHQQLIGRSFIGEIELHESYFGGKNKGERGRATDKIPVFGLLKRKGRVYTQIIKTLARVRYDQLLKA